MSAAARRSTARKHRCVSADGTPLTVRRVGAGPPLVMVHGTCGRLHDFRALESYLHQTHEVWSFDRRGRGDSGDTEPYALEREVEDLVAVLDAAGPGLRVVSNYAIGVDNIDVPAATARKILVCNTPDVLTDTTADLAFALLLAGARRLFEASAGPGLPAWRGAASIAARCRRRGRRSRPRRSCRSPPLAARRRTGSWRGPARP